MKIFFTILSLSIILLTSTICSQPAKYNLEVPGYLIELSRDSLVAQYGIIEATGHNDGETLKYQKPFGVYGSYCAMGQDWCYWVNCDCKLSWFSPNAQSHFNYAKKHGQKAKYIPEKDDFIVWKRGGVSGHIERITAVRGGGFTDTGGFNTSNGKKGSQYNGNGVFPRIRHIYNPVGLLLIKGLVGIKPIKISKGKEGCNYE